MLEIAESKHHVPGRMRLYLPSARRNPELLERVRSALGSLAGVHRIEPNLTIGAIIVYYEPSMSGDFPRMLSEFAERENLFWLDPSLAGSNGPNGQSLTDQALDVVAERVNRAVQGATWNAISLKELFPFGIATWALLFVNRAVAAAQWLNWIQFAWSSYFELHQEEPIHEVQQQIASLRGDLAGIRELLEQNLRAKSQS